MLCGSPPYSEYKGVLRLITAKTDGSYQRLSQRDPQLPHTLVEIIEKAMAHRAEDRYPSPMEMKQKLLAFYKAQKNAMQIK
jgi:hypothetical protein